LSSLPRPSFAGGPIEHGGTAKLRRDRISRGAIAARSGYSFSPAQRQAPPETENAMHLMYFTEQPMSAYPAQEGLDFGATALMFSNKYFDPAAGSRLYNEYLEDYIYAEEMGIEGIMLNEHHNAPFCMQAKCNIFASILAAVTKKARCRSPRTRSGWPRNCR
jgi:hypothetical protein